MKELITANWDTLLISAIAIVSFILIYWNKERNKRH